MHLTTMLLSSRRRGRGGSHKAESLLGEALRKSCGDVIYSVNGCKKSLPTHSTTPAGQHLPLQRSTADFVHRSIGTSEAGTVDRTVFKC